MSGRDRHTRHVLSQAALLGGFVTLATSLLLFSDAATRDSIVARQHEDLMASLDQIVPAQIYDQPLLDHVIEVKDASGTPRAIYQAVRGGSVTAVAFEWTASGYAGPIELLLGVDADGGLLGVRVTAHAETPGLGDRIEAEKDDWIRSFDGRSIGDPPLERWTVRKDGGDFDQFSGATITPRAVTGAVKDGLLFFGAKRNVVLRPLESTTASLAKREAE